VPGLIEEENTFLMISVNIVQAEHGIIHETMMPYSPQSNGVVERKNRTLTDLVYPKPWWGEAILTSCFVLNRVPSSKGEITLYE
jgi:transposase InsO family protein